MANKKATATPVIPAPAPVKIGPSYQYAAEVKKILDGDTFDMIVDLGFHTYQQIRVRLHDFDTAEIFHPANEAELEHANKAKKLVEKTIPVGTRVVITTAKMAAYGRWEARVFYTKGIGKLAPQLSLRDTLMAAGMAKKPSYT